MTQVKYTLMNAEELAALSPQFEIPDVEARKNLKAGDDAKLIFSFGERMWVTVIDYLGTGYVGVLISTPVHSGLITTGDRVRFGPEHIASLDG